MKKLFKKLFKKTKEVKIENDGYLLFCGTYIRMGSLRGF